MRGIAFQVLVGGRGRGFHVLTTGPARQEPIDRFGGEELPGAEQQLTADASLHRHADPAPQISFSKDRGALRTSARLGNCSLKRQAPLAPSGKPACDGSRTHFQTGLHSSDVKNCLQKKQVQKMTSACRSMQDASVFEGV